VEAVKGNHIESDVTTYEMKTECEICDTDTMIKFLENKVLVKKDLISGKMLIVDRRAIFCDFFDAGLKATPDDIMAILNKGNQIATDSHVYQYLDKEKL
jgi:hypothetical protein